MRKLKFILFALSLCATSLVFAQEESDIFTRHEVSLGYGPFFQSTSFWSPDYYSARDDYFGAISASYTYKFNKVIGIGATLAFDHNNQKIYDLRNDNVAVCNLKQNIITALVHVKVNWVRTKIVTMYSKVGLGGSYYANNVTRLQPEEAYEIKPENLKKFDVGYSIIPVGIELGTKQYAGFLQMGYGVEGIFSIGFRYGINKTYKK